MGSVNARPLVDQSSTHHTGDAAAIEFRRRDTTVAYQKQIRRDAFDEIAVDVAHQAFPNVRIVPLCACENLFKTIEVFEPRKGGLCGKSGLTDSHSRADAAIDDLGWRRKQGQYAARRTRIASISATTLPGSHEHFGDSVALRGYELCKFRIDQFEVQRNSNCCAVASRLARW